MAGRQCVREGCRAWARRGGMECVAHDRQTGRGSESDVARAYGRRGRARFAANTPVAQLEAALGQSSDDLQAEIAVTRLLLVELLRADLPTDKLVMLVDKATGALARLLRANREIAGPDAGEVDEAIARVLREIGVMGDR